MSTLAAAVDVDLEGNAATVDIFDGGECRLYEDEHGWRGFERDGGAYYWIDTRTDEWTGRLRVSEGAVRETLRRYLAGEPAAMPPGRPVRR